MNLETLFKLSSIIAGVGWIVLIFISPYWKAWDKFLAGVIIVILALTYSFLNFTNFKPDNLSDFFSLDGIQSLYINKALLLAGWEHFLAFDLLVAVWIKRNSIKYGIRHWVILPAIIFTCMLGPLGFLIYLLTRWIKTKNYFAENFN